jgi:hypothetical protein
MSGGARALTPKQQLGLGLAALALALAVAAYSYLTRPIICCSCVCQKPDGASCLGSKGSGSAKRGCEQICADACKIAGLECEVKEASKINDGKCGGYW